MGAWCHHRFIDEPTSLRMLGPAAASPAPPRRLGAVDAASTPARSTFELTAGMSDVDAYAFLYYAQYVKYNERAASEAAGSPLVLSSVESMIFGRPARWGENIKVVTFLCPPAACEEEQPPRVVTQPRRTGGAVREARAISYFQGWIRPFQGYTFENPQRPSLLFTISISRLSNTKCCDRGWPTSFFLSFLAFGPCGHPSWCVAA